MTTKPGWGDRTRTGSASMCEVFGGNLSRGCEWASRRRTLQPLPRLMHGVHSGTGKLPFELLIRKRPGHHARLEVNDQPTIGLATARIPLREDVIVGPAEYSNCSPDVA